MTVPAPNATPTFNPDECKRLGRCDQCGWEYKQPRGHHPNCAIEEGCDEPKL